jgi:hypothetical protein
VATVNETPTTNWKMYLQLGSGYYRISITTEPAGGTAGATSLKQNGLIGNYGLECIASSSANEDSYFQLLPFDEYPTISSDDDITWLTISSAQSSLSGKCLTELAGTSSPNIQYSMATIETNNSLQQWKIVKKNPAAGDGLVEFINRSTGHVISTSPVYDIQYSYVQYAENASSSVGWKLRPLANYQYEVYTGAADAGKFWNAATAGNAASEYREGNSLNTGFAWKFRAVTDVTAIYTPSLPEGVRVFAKEGRICVEGADQYTVHTIYGARVDETMKLQTGVYLVTVKGKTSKVLVK